jgi:DNA invertase Pin-like site-specific DNA recombinase
MIESEERNHSIAEQKARIRERYKGIDTDELDVIPALPQENFYDDQREKRVAVYARVSTDDPRQTSSYELQKNHYLDVVSRHPGWNMVDIYADEGISGTSLQHRDNFIRMIADCRAGKIDLVVTKSVSRFARNVLDCIGYVRQLAALTPPIGIFFETENIYTLNSNSEMSLSFISTLAQEESHNKSEIMNASVEMRFRRGIFLTPPLLGYDVDEDGRLVINEDEAKTVRLIFFMYLYGYSCQRIAETLTKLGRQTKKGNTNWSVGSVIQILQNERHCGDVLARKTWTPNYLDHKSKKNRQDRNQYRQKNHHEAIVSRDDFIAVQRMLSNSRYGGKGILPELRVIPDGSLKGFVYVNPRWAGFTEQDYHLASASVSEGVEKIPSKPLEFEVNAGTFDLRGYEVARAQFFSTNRKISMTVSPDNLVFSTYGVQKFSGVPYVEILVHPGKMLLAVRPSAKDNRHSIRWSKSNDAGMSPRIISGAAFLPTLYRLFGWQKDCKYRIRGVKKQDGNDAVLLFDMHDTEVLLPQSAVLLNSGADCSGSVEDAGEEQQGGRSRRVLAFPAEWADGFGSEYYRQVTDQAIEKPDDDTPADFGAEGKPFSKDPPLQVTSTEEIGQNIKAIIEELKQEDSHE